jgi:hypothetical protein
LVPYPGTEIYRELGGIHFNPSDNWSDYSAFGDNLALRLHNISSEKLKHYCALAYRKFYLRPTYLARRIKNLSSFTEFKNSVTSAVSLFSKYLKN